MHIEHEALTELVAREGFAQLLCPSYIRSECTLKHLYLHSVKSNFVLEFENAYENYHIYVGLNIN